MSEPLISVILPTYNRAHLLRRSIDSVLNQTHRHLELLVIDDGSTDDTQALLSSYRDDRLKVLSPGRLGSAGRARNVGLQHAKGEWIAFQDSDDAWLLDKLARQLALAQQHPKASVTICGYMVVLPEGTLAEYRGAALLARDSDFGRLMRYGYEISTPSWLVRRALLEEVGHFDERLETWEDWELSMRLHARGDFQVVDEPLMIAFETAGSVKWNFDAYARTLDAIMQKHPAWVTDQHRVLAHHRWLQAFWEMRMERPRAARAYIAQAFAKDPLDPRLWMRTLRYAHHLFLKKSEA